MAQKSELTQLDSLKQVLYKKILNRMQPKASSFNQQWLLCGYMTSLTKVSESAEKGEVKFIEKNLEELSRVHKKVNLPDPLIFSVSQPDYYNFSLV